MADGATSSAEPLPEALREDEEATREALAALEQVARHKELLERMPDSARAFPAGVKPSWRRRTYVVDWKLQLSYAGLYIATVTLFVVGFAATNLIFFRLLQGVRLNAKVPATYWWQQDDVGVYLILNFVVVLFVGMGMALWAIVQSHRVAGPALRFRRALKQIQRRDYDFFLQLRKNDYLKDLAADLNATNNALKAKDIILADAALRVEALARTATDAAVRTELRELAIELADLSLPLPEETPAT